FILARLSARSKDREARAFRPLKSSYFETIHLSCYNLDICKDNYFSSSEFLLTPRVVDPLSLATIADSIMVEVEDLNHYGVGLFDYGIDLFNIVCSIPFFVFHLIS
ncbi:MAG: hypothetical protein KIH03_03735, partial [Paludibacteraceae bacterium]|nr:hypothetical protein [Paludibacteraceae bacterium]